MVWNSSLNQVFFTLGEPLIRGFWNWCNESQATWKKKDNGIESAYSVWVCVFSQDFYLFQLHMCILYGNDVKAISVALLWAVVETCESCWCNLYSYFTLLCISEIEQQKLLGGQKIGFLLSLLLVGRVERHNSGSPYAL